MSACPVCAAEVASGRSRCERCGASLTTRIANQPREMPRQHPTTTFVRRSDGSVSTATRAAAPSGARRSLPPQQGVGRPLLLGLLALAAVAGAVVWFMRPDLRTVELGHGFTAALPPSWIETHDAADRVETIGISKRFTCVHDKVRMQTEALADVKEAFTSDKARQLLVMQMRQGGDALVGPNDVVDLSKDGLVRLELTGVDRKALVSKPATLAADDYKRCTIGIIMDASGKRVLEYVVAYDDESEDMLRVCASMAVAAP